MEGYVSTKAKAALGPLGKVAAEKLLELWTAKNNPWADAKERELLAEVSALHQRIITDGDDKGPPELQLTDRTAAAAGSKGSNSNSAGDVASFNWVPVATSRRQLQDQLEATDWAEYEDIDLGTCKCLLSQLDDTKPGVLRQVVLELHWWLLVELPKLLLKCPGATDRRPDWKERIQMRINYLERLRQVIFSPKRSSLTRMFESKEEGQKRKKKLVWVFQEMEIHLKEAVQRKEEENAQRQSAELLDEVCRRTKTAISEVMRALSLVLNDTDMPALPTFKHVDQLLESTGPGCIAQRHPDDYSPIAAYARTSLFAKVFCCIRSHNSLRAALHLPPTEAEAEAEPTSLEERRLNAEADFFVARVGTQVCDSKKEAAQLLSEADKLSSADMSIQAGLPRFFAKKDLPGDVRAHAAECVEALLETAMIRCPALAYYLKYLGLQRETAQAAGEVLFSLGAARDTVLYLKQYHLRHIRVSRPKS